MSGWNQNRKTQYRTPDWLTHRLELIFALLLVAVGIILFVIGIFKPIESDWRAWLTTGGIAVMTGGLIAVVFRFLFARVIIGQVRDAVREELERTNKFIQNCSDAGLKMIYKRRSEAVDDFWRVYIELEAPPEISIIGVSLRGEEANGKSMVERIAEAMKKSQFRILLTHPQYSRIRARQEHELGDNSNGIANDISETLQLLKEHNVPKECIKLYKGVSTAFVVATDRWMLIQPYPHQWTDAASALFTLIAEKDHSFGIYERWWEKNVDAAWKDSELSEDYNPDRDYSKDGLELLKI